MFRPQPPATGGDVFSRQTAIAPPPGPKPQLNRKLVVWVTKKKVMAKVVTNDAMAEDVSQKAGFEWVRGWIVDAELGVNVPKAASPDLIEHMFGGLRRGEEEDLVKVVTDKFFPGPDTEMQPEDQRVTPEAEKGDDDLAENPPPGLTPLRRTKGEKRPAEDEANRVAPKAGKVEGTFGTVKLRYYDKQTVVRFEEPGVSGIPLPPGEAAEESADQKAEREAKEAEAALAKAEAAKAAKREQEDIDAMVLETSRPHREELTGAIRKIKLWEQKTADRFMPATSLMRDIYEVRANRKLVYDWRTNGKKWLFMVAVGHYQPTAAEAGVLDSALTLLEQIGDQIGMKRAHYGIHRLKMGAGGKRNAPLIVVCEDKTAYDRLWATGGFAYQDKERDVAFIPQASDSWGTHIVQDVMNAPKDLEKVKLGLVATYGPYFKWDANGVAADVRIAEVKLGARAAPSFPGSWVPENENGTKWRVIFAYNPIAATQKILPARSDFSSGRGNVIFSDPPACDKCSSIGHQPRECSWWEVDGVMAIKRKPDDFVRTEWIPIKALRSEGGKFSVKGPVVEVPLTLNQRAASEPAGDDVVEEDTLPQPKFGVLGGRMSAPRGGGKPRGGGGNRGRGNGSRGGRGNKGGPN